MSLDEKSIIDYLIRHPDFLTRHPDLLRHLTVPHGFQGKTVSLIEYQSKIMRERLRELEQQYRSESLKSNTHRNLSRHLPLLLIALYECAEEKQLLVTLSSFLVEHLAASDVRIFSASVSGNSENVVSDLIRPLDPWRRGLFTLILNNPKPLCDSLQHEHLVALFDKRADYIHSSLLYPFRYQGEEALLAVGSVDWQKYKQSVELDFLTAVIEVVSRLSEPQIA